MILERDVTRRRYSKVRLYNAGRILHLARYKPPQADKRYLKLFFHYYIFFNETV